MTNHESRLIAAARGLTIPHHVGTERTSLVEAVELGRGIHAPQWHEFKRALDALRAAETPCPTCGGTGEDADEPREDCRTCEGYGWVLE